MQAIRVLIADDEPPARARLRQLLDTDEAFEVAGECASGREAVTAIRELAPDLVFLDVQMPELDGLQVVAEIGPEAMPAVIFVTAYNEYALRAFEVHALDYLLKPFDDTRFATALARAVEEVRRDRLDGLCGRLKALLGEMPDATPSASLPSARTRPERLVIRSAGRTAFVDAAAVDWIEAAGSYVRLHAGTRSHLLRDSLSRLEERLAAERFVRIHRSTMVNARRVRELRALSHGESLVVLRDGTELKLSRGYRDRLERLLRA